MDIGKLLERFGSKKIRPLTAIVIAEVMLFLFSIETLIEWFNIHPIVFFSFFGDVGAGLREKLAELEREIAELQRKNVELERKNVESEREKAESELEKAELTAQLAAALPQPPSLSQTQPKSTSKQLNAHAAEWTPSWATK
jgi:hypothetical protein